MSLSKLPTPLLAQIASFLEFENIKNLLLVNKRINGALKKYNLDKPKCFKVAIAHFEEENFFTIRIFLNEWTSAENGPVIEKKENWTLEDNDLADKMFAIVNKFMSIEELHIIGIDISNEFFDLLSRTKQKLRELFVTKGGFESREVFQKSCVRFDKVTCLDAELNLDEIATDEVFCAAVKLINIKISGALSMCLSFGLVFCAAHQYFHEVSLTDRVLESLSSCVEASTEKLSIPLWITSFTVERVKQLFEKIASKEPTDFSCDLGLMKMNQMEAAEDFIDELDANPTFNGKVIDCYYWKTCEIFRLNGGKNKFVITFNVMKANFFDDNEGNVSSDNDGDLGESDTDSENEDEEDNEANEPIE